MRSSLSEEVKGLHYAHRGQLTESEHEKGNDIPFGDVDDSPEFELASTEEVLDSQVVHPSMLSSCRMRHTRRCMSEGWRGPDGFRL